jgi:hypothetical protein
MYGPEDPMSGHSFRRDQRNDLGPPHPSAHLPRDTSMGTSGLPVHYPDDILEVW